MTNLSALVRAALAEDVGAGDVTTAACVPPGRPGRARVIARAPGVIAGLAAIEETYAQVDPGITVALEVADGDRVATEQVVYRAEGAFAGLLIAERTALNFLQRLSGVATRTAALVAAIDGSRARIVDTRKTTPGWRALEKAAVRAGGGTNHRFGLHDAYLIKENHIAAAGGIPAALARVAERNPAGRPVEIEVRSLAELEQALTAPDVPGRILCDNFPLAELIRAVERIRAASGDILIEASGNVTLDTVRPIAEAGVDWISVGGLTHSAPALDLSCLISAA
ncbi:MAG: carboxylating nicotinate-nucleotide diphosphorylase [Gemmatimonadota bacterium]